MNEGMCIAIRTAAAALFDCRTQRSEQVGRLATDAVGITAIGFIWHSQPPGSPDIRYTSHIGGAQCPICEGINFPLQQVGSYLVVHQETMAGHHISLMSTKRVRRLVNESHGSHAESRPAASVRMPTEMSDFPPSASVFVPVEKPAAELLGARYQLIDAMKADRSITPMRPELAGIWSPWRKNSRKESGLARNDDASTAFIGSLASNCWFTPIHHGSSACACAKVGGEEKAMSDFSRDLRLDNNRCRLAARLAHLLAANSNSSSPSRIHFKDGGDSKDQE